MSQLVLEQTLGGAGQLRGFRGGRPAPRIRADSPFGHQSPGQRHSHGGAARPAADAPVEDRAAASRQDAEARRASEEEHWEPSPVREVIELSAEDQRIFAEAILNPPPPSPRLRKAVQRYLKIMNRR